MKKRRFLSFVTVCILIAVAAAACAFVSRDRGEPVKEQARRRSGGIHYTVLDNDNFDVLEDKSTQSCNNEINRIYDNPYRRRIRRRLARMKSRRKCRDGRMIIIHNPFGTNTLSLYFFFYTRENEKTTYTISVNDDSIPDFRKAVNEPFTKKHEFTITGLVPDQKNHITLDFTSESGKKRHISFDYDMGPKLGEEETVLTQTEPGSKSSPSGVKNEKPSPVKSTAAGLYAIIGNIRREVDFTYLYDKNGVLRAEIPIRGYCSMRLQFHRGLMYYAISNTRIAAVNNLWQVEKIYRTHSRYRMHHDFIVNPEGQVMALAEYKNKRTVEDSIISFDNKTGEVNRAFCMTKLLGKYIKKNCVRRPGSRLDWIHLNTIQWMGKGNIALSSRETSAVIKVEHIFKKPRIGWIMGESRVWKGLSYRKYLLKKIGNFSDSGGQHTVTYMPLAGKPDYIYDMYMFDNNYGRTPSRKNFDWSVIKGINNETHPADISSVNPSRFLLYRINEKKGTYRLLKKFPVPYSSLVSSAQIYKNREVVIDSGVDLGMITVYDLKGRVKQRFKMKLDQDRIYRVFKYSFEGFLFAHEK